MQNSTGPGDFIVEFYQKFNGKLIQILLKMLYAIATEGSIPTSYTKPHNDTNKKVK